jgi:hypothetical protein
MLIFGTKHNLIHSYHLTWTICLGNLIIENGKVYELLLARTSFLIILISENIQIVHNRDILVIDFWNEA